MVNRQVQSSEIQYNSVKRSEKIAITFLASSFPFYGNKKTNNFFTSCGNGLGKIGKVILLFNNKKFIKKFFKTQRTSLCVVLNVKKSSQSGP